ncbi:hypothetical protein ACNHKD_07970 [Methylocystis sp. JAN1]|uniref:hypothetical protein n=1 Tax=Methylocystis sp. JAN1 TaxID=3397211 RepID=UPI003FA2DEB8
MRVSYFLLEAAAFACLCLAGSNALALCTNSPMSGDWVSANGATRGLTRAEVEVGCCDQVLNGQPACSPPDSVRLFGKCHPTDCDWGVRTGAFQTSGGLRLTYDQGFARRTVRINSLSNGNLRVRVFTDFSDPRRVDYNMTEIMRPE